MAAVGKIVNNVKNMPKLTNSVVAEKYNKQINFPPTHKAGKMRARIFRVLAVI